LSAESLSAVDPVLRDRMRKAVLAADARGLATAIATLAESDSALADSLRSLADRYEYDKLGQLL
jgi:hypothetical protein